MALAGDTPHAFTVRYHGRGAAARDESHLARSLAERYGVRFTIMDVEPDVRDIFEPIVRALDEPHADQSAILSLISEAVSTEHKVALGGTGGDELFAGYRRHLGVHRLKRFLRTGGATAARALRGTRRAGARLVH